MVVSSNPTATDMSSAGSMNNGNSDVNTHPQARLRIFQPHRSGTTLGYMVDSLDVFVTPQKNSPPGTTVKASKEVNLIANVDSLSDAGAG